MKRPGASARGWGALGTHDRPCLSPSRDGTGGLQPCSPARLGSVACVRLVLSSLAPDGRVRARGESWGLLGRWAELGIVGSVQKTSPGGLRRGLAALHWSHGGKGARGHGSVGAPISFPQKTWPSRRPRLSRRSPPGGRQKARQPLSRADPRVSWHLVKRSPA